MYPWVIFFLLPTIAVFAMDGGSNRVRPSFQPFDLALFFPSNLSAVLTRTAEAFSVPFAGMLNLMLFFSSILASTTYISGPGGAQIEPLIAYFLNFGDSGINKTGLSKIFEYLLLEVTTVLRKFSLHTSTLFEKGLSIHRHDLPIRDCSGTPAAAIQKQSRNRVLVRVDDEWGVRARALANGTSGGGMENGAQQQLQLFNGPNTMLHGAESFSQIYVHLTNFYDAHGEVLPADFGYDAGCHLRKFSELRKDKTPRALSFWMRIGRFIFVDRFHWRNHKNTHQYCQEFCIPNEINELKAGVEEARIPRWMCSSNIQPKIN